MIYKKKGFTIVEVIICLVIGSILFGAIYSAFNKSFFTNQKNMESLNALQEMAFIIFNLRHDLHSFVEIENQELTRMKYNSSESSFTFLKVSGIDVNGKTRHSLINYRLGADASFVRTEKDYDNQCELIRQKMITRPKTINEFKINIFNKENIDITSGNAAVKNGKPYYIDIHIAHKSNKKLEANLVLCSLYALKNESAINCWISGVKVSSEDKIQAYYDNSNTSNQSNANSYSVPPDMMSSYPNKL